MLQERDIYKLLGSFIASEVHKQMQPVLTALDTAQKMISEFQAKEESLRVQLADVVRVVGDLPVPRDGKDGEKGEKGEKGEPGEPGKDGLNGSNGADGQSLSLDDVRDHLAELARETVAGLPVPVHCVGGHLDRSGHLHLRFSDGSDSDLGEVVGKDCDVEAVKSQVAAFLATIEKPKDGLGLEDMEYDGERTFTMSNGKANKTFVIPFPIYQGIWKQRAYVRGDQVTSDNQQWMAMRDTDKEPGTIDSGWRLACRRGRDGKDAKK